MIQIIDIIARLLLNSGISLFWFFSLCQLSTCFQLVKNILGFHLLGSGPIDPTTMFSDLPILAPKCATIVPH